VDPRFEADQLRAALEQQVFPEVIAPVHLQREPAEVAELLLAQAEERAALSPELGRRRGGSPPPRRSRGYAAVRAGFLSQQSSEERDSHHAASLLTVPEPLWSLVRPGRVGRRALACADEEDDEQDEPGRRCDEHHGEEEPQGDAEDDQGDGYGDHVLGMPAARRPETPAL
jgi:hypothetical protein